MTDRDTIIAAGALASLCVVCILLALANAELAYRVDRLERALATTQADLAPPDASDLAGPGRPPAATPAPQDNTRRPFDYRAGDAPI